MKKVVVLGGSGLIGQQFLRMLANHPKFELIGAFTSANSAGQTVGDLWVLPGFNCPKRLEEFTYTDMIDLNSEAFDIAFSGLPASISTDLESKLRSEGIAVFTNAGGHRMDDDVPILIPEVNPDHANLVKIQKELYGGNGFIVANANCSATGAVLYLSELRKIIPFTSINITTYQAMSGAGKRGVAGLEISNNVIPFINAEEDKLRIESLKMLGKMNADSIEFAEYRVATNCARVNVVDGHLEAITVEPENGTSIDQEKIISQLASITSPLNLKNHPSGPKTHLKYLSGNNRPQPVKDVFFGDSAQTYGMVVTAGRIRVQDGFVNGFALVHNTIRGGAGGSVLNAEFLLSKGMI